MHKPVQQCTDQLSLERTNHTKLRLAMVDVFMMHLNTLMLHCIDISVERNIYGEPKRDQLN
jgi:hypothetical protein